MKIGLNTNSLTSLPLAPELREAKQDLLQAEDRFESARGAQKKNLDRLDTFTTTATMVSGLALALPCIVAGAMSSTLLGTVASGALGTMMGLGVGTLTFLGLGKVTDLIVGKTTGPRYESARDKLDKARDSYRNTLLNEIGDEELRQSSDKEWNSEIQALGFTDRHLRLLEERAGVSTPQPHLN